MHPFHIIANIQHNAGENVKYQRETDCQERGIDKKQAYFADGNMKTLAQVGANPKRITFKEGEDPL